MSGRWPVTLQDGPVGLRPIKRSDVAAWREVRSRNDDWLRPWEATAPLTEVGMLPTYSQMVARLRAEARAGRCLPFAITLDGVFVGQLTVAGITHGSASMAHLGYWIDQRVAGQGITPTAVALAIDHCFIGLGLHRVEIHIRPENSASLRVVEKLGLRYEGVRRAYLHIDGDWRDHMTYVVTREEVVPDGLLARWKSTLA